ncbi:MAG: phosphatase PAP2 family protein [Myxococcota bacterium]
MNSLMLVLVIAASESPYDVDWAVDGTVAGGALGLSILVSEINPSLPGGLSCARMLETRCDPSVLNSMDATVVGNDSQGWETVSDIGLWGGLLIPFAANGLDLATGDSTDRGRDFGRDSLVMAQAIGVNAFVTTLAKAAFRRPRPTHYVTGKDLSAVQESYSFPSGHASATASGMASWATTFALRRPNSPWRFAVIGSAVAWTGVTAYGRVRAGRHFYTDVLAGVILGSAVGFLVPKLHERDTDNSSEAAADRSNPMLIQIGGRF